MINERYTILGMIGKGGAGEVFLAEDTLSGNRIALKLLSLSRRVEENSIGKEFSVLADLSHPNLVRVFDFGTVTRTDEPRYAGRLFYTMEHLDGEDALGYFEAIATGSRRVELLEELCIQTLGVLDYIHRQGVIHFDVKPHNVLILPSKEARVLTVKLTDFGFSTRTVEMVDLPLRGTLEYTAPEIVQGHSIDQRADLYSLGVTLFHLWTGHCPFEAGSPVDLLKKTLSEPLPEIPTVGGVESKLPEIIGALCQKNPDKRPASAREALLRLISKKHEQSVKRAMYIDRGALFVGRSDEKRIVTDMLDGLQGTKRAFIKPLLIAGPEGIGKSALLSQIKREARERGILVLESRVRQGPFESMMPVLRQLAAEFRTRTLAETTDTSSPGKPIGSRATPGLPNSMPSQPAAGGPQRQREDYKTFLQSASTALPFLLLVDDLDEIDESSRETICDLGRSPREGGMVIIASVSHEPGDPILGADAERIVLPELSIEDVLTMLRLSFGEELASNGIAERIHRLYGGVPAMIVEAAASAAGALPIAVLTDPMRKNETATTFEEFLSIKFEQRFGGRYRMLDREQQRLVEFLSCFETVPSADTLGRVVSLDKEELERLLVSLEREGYLLATGEPKRRYSLRHLKLRQSVYDSLREQRQLHAAIAETIASRVPPADWIDIGELGRQYELSGGLENACSRYASASDAAYASGAFAEALTLVKKALACSSQERSDEHALLLVRLAEAYVGLGSDSESVSAYGQLLAMLPETDARRAGIHTAVGKSFARLGKPGDAVGHFEAALSSAPGEKDRFEIQQEIISLKIAEGNFEEAVKLILRQKEFAAAQTDRELLALVETDLGIAEFFRGNFQDSLGSFTTALEIYELHNEVKTIDALNNIGNVLSAMRDFRGALVKWEDALERCDDQGTPYQRGQILNNMGIAHFKLEEYREAASHYEQAKEIFDGLKSRRGSAFALTNLGEVTFAEGEYEQTLNYWTQSYALYDEMHDSEGMAQMLLGFVQLHIALENVGLAGRKLDEAERLIQEFRLPTFGGLVSYLRGLCLQQVNRGEQALAAFRAAESAFQQEGSFTGGTESARDKWLLSRLRQAEVFHEMRLGERAAGLLKELLDEHPDELSPRLEAEIRYRLGIVARECPDLIGEKALVCFREGLALIRDDHLSELSWKISFALGEEYARRGNSEKAREHYRNTKLVLDYFISKFSSDDLRAQYVGSGSRAPVITALGSCLLPAGGEP
ncbi:MAG: tetratricopeptide repeat protein [Ignavibacteria bacterium]|nr:MAG: tetratricopeptide repeat protein [Ignavibacteria bacterium]